MTSIVKLVVTGMTCGHCVKHAKESLESVPGVEKVDVTLEPGSAVIHGEADVDALIAAVRNAGYEASAAG